MRSSQAAPLWFLAGLATASVIFVTMRAADSARFKGDILVPLQAIVADTTETMISGNSDLAQRKLALLDQKLSEYRTGGPSPELFASEIEGLK